MVKSKWHSKQRILLVIIVIVLAFLAVFFVMQQVQNLLYGDAEINLAEIVTQNKDVITSRLNVQTNELEVASKHIMGHFSDGEEVTTESLNDAFLQYYAHYRDPSMFVSDTKGNAYFFDGDQADISGREYFQVAMQGDLNVSERVVSYTYDEDVYIVSIPLYKDRKIIGTLQKQYREMEMYELCEVSLFSEQGYTDIITSNGNIVIGANECDDTQEAENYYNILTEQGNKEQAEQLKQDIQNNQAGNIKTNVCGVSTYSAYTPIDEIYDWYLVSSVASSAVSSNANQVILMFYIILIVIVVSFIGCILSFMRYKNRQQKKLSKIAYVDSLTNGHTYNKFEQVLKSAILDNPEKQFYLMTFDIDNFKYINNFYGFDFGDNILRTICSKVGERLKDGELIARSSSDHFMVLLEDASPERLDKILASAQDIDDFKLYLSAGVYEIANRDESISMMVDKASMAAQDVKGVPHKMLQYYSQKFDEQMVYNEQLKRSIESALANSEIVPFFQPKIDINTLALVGAEALARWRTSDGRIIFPSEFIPLCEKTGLIAELDIMVFEKMLAFLKKNLEEGINCVPISVNFSRLHLSNENFVELIDSKLKEYGVPPNLVELEITESVIFESYGVISDFISRLHEKGLSISMDDFGSGYSSLNMLKDVQIDIMKIDRGFLLATADSERQRIIFAAIAQMARELKIKVVVEGVETLENVELMREYGCNVAQGFYYSRPLDMPAFEEIFKRGAL